MTRYTPRILDIVSAEMAWLDGWRVVAKRAGVDVVCSLSSGNGESL